MTTRFESEFAAAKQKQQIEKLRQSIIENLSNIKRSYNKTINSFQQNSKQSEAQLKSVIEARDQRIRAMQTQLVALHKMTKNVTALKAELKELRTALASAEKDAH